MPHKTDLKAIAIIGVFYACLMALGVTCPIRALTGISCAGCGMTRAWLALLRLDLRAAWSYHPLFFMPVPAAGIFLFRHRLPHKLVQGSMIFILGLFLAVYFVRMMQPEDTIVTFAPQEGLFYRLITYFFRSIHV